jgi:hypothetical protein
MANANDILTFTARPSTILINCEVETENRDNRSVVTYELRPTMFELWERINDRPWVKVDISARAENFDAISGSKPSDGLPGTREHDEYMEYKKRLASAGRFFSPFLLRGDVYEVRLFDGTLTPFDPNVDGDGQHLAALDVFALCSKPKEESLLRDIGFLEIGGTYCFLSILSGALTRMKSWIGEIPPDPPSVPDGTQELKSPTAVVTTTGLATSHSHELKPLLPGTPYYILLRLSDRFGNWQFVNLTNTTKRRLATVYFDKIHMINDSDGASRGNSYYRFSISEAGGVVFAQRFPPSGESILGDGESASLPPTLGQYFGPKRILPGGGAIMVAVRGFDVDRLPPPFSDSEETASNYDDGFGFEGTPLDIPFGRFMETVSGRKTLHAIPETVDNQFEFLVEVNYTITYV